MGIVNASIFFFAPLTLSILVLGWLGKEQGLRVARHLLVFEGVLALLLMPVFGRLNLHLFWAAQVPLMALFLGSGVLLAGADTSPRAGARATWLFLALTLLLAVAPLFVQQAGVLRNPGRPVDSPAGSLVELAAWGLGGPLPAGLEPTEDTPEERTVGHLPRLVTVPVASTLLAAWLWMGFLLLRLLRPVVPPRLLRVLPGLGALALYVTVPVIEGPPWFDPRMLFPGPNSSLWRSDPASLRTYGPVVAVACLLALGTLAWDTVRWRREGSRGTGRGGSRSHG